MKLVHPEIFSPNEGSRGYTVTFPDLTGAVTSGETPEDTVKRRFVKFHNTCMAEHCVGTCKYQFFCCLAGGTHEKNNIN